MPPLRARSHRIYTIPKHGDVRSYVHRFLDDPAYGMYLVGARVYMDGSWHRAEMPDMTLPITEYLDPDSPTLIRTRSASSLMSVRGGGKGPNTWKLTSFPKRVSTVNCNGPLTGNSNCPLCSIAAGIVFMRWDGCVALQDADHLKPVKLDFLLIGSFLDKQRMLCTQLFCTWVACRYRYQSYVANSQQDWTTCIDSKVC